MVFISSSTESCQLEVQAVGPDSHASPRPEKMLVAKAFGFQCRGWRWRRSPSTPYRSRNENGADIFLAVMVLMDEEGAAMGFICCRA